jgi:peptidoglycan/xylan/chitin deacetylase (PgdA/CDA1 family)
MHRCVGTRVRPALALLVSVVVGAALLVRGHARACLLGELPRAEDSIADEQLGLPLQGAGIVTGATPRRMLHFTFDDGPTAENTPRLLDALDRAGIKATFFFSTSRFASRERRNSRSVELAREVARRGHEIGAHGFDHIRMSHLRPSAVRDELQSAEAMFLRAFGARTYLFRPPYGSRNRALDRMLADGRYLTVMWNVGLADWVAHDPEELRKIFWRVLQRNERLDGERGGVVLLHDSHDWSVAAFERIAESIAARNCELLARGEELYDVVDSLMPWVTPPSDETYAAWQQQLREQTSARCGAEASRTVAMVKAPQLAPASHSAL